MEIVLKAYKLVVNDIVDEPWHWNDIIIYAKTAGEAKSKGLSEFEGAKVNDLKGMSWSLYRDVKYTDIKAYRIKEMDKVLYEGIVITKAEVKQKEWQKQRDKEALELSQNYPDSMAVVYAGCYGSYWGANRSGYTSKIENAGKYSTKDAYEIVRGSDYNRQEKVILLDGTKYNAEIDIKIEQLLKSKI